MDNNRIMPNSEQTVDALLRPADWNDYVGQDKVKRNLRVILSAAKKRGEACDHLLFYGQAGLGKTTLAYLVGKEMGVTVNVTSGPALEKMADLAAVLTNLLLLQQGYVYMPYISHEKLVEDNKPEYYLALRQSQKTFRTEKETITPWATFFFSMLHEQSRRAVELLSREQTDKLLSKQQQLVWRFIEKMHEAAPLEITKATGVPRPTVNQALTKLLKLKRIERLGVGRGTRYRKI